MSRKSVTARQAKRERIVAQYADRRKALKEAGDYEALDKLPKNASPVRLKNRCDAYSGSKHHKVNAFICL